MKTGEETTTTTTLTTTAETEEEEEVTTNTNPEVTEGETECNRTFFSFWNLQILWLIEFVFVELNDCKQISSAEASKYANVSNVFEYVYLLLKTN